MSTFSGKVSGLLQLVPSVYRHLGLCLWWKKKEDEGNNTSACFMLQLCDTNLELPLVFIIYGHIKWFEIISRQKRNWVVLRRRLCGESAPSTCRTPQKQTAAPGHLVFHCYSINHGFIVAVDSGKTGNLSCLLSYYIYMYEGGCCLSVCFSVSGFHCSVDESNGHMIKGTLSKV